MAIALGLKMPSVSKRLQVSLDCLHAEMDLTVNVGADSVMIARAAEANPSCFSPTPLVDVGETLMPDYLRLVSSHRVNSRS